MNKELEQKIVDIVKSVMDVDIKTLSPSTRFNTLPAWDSFNNLMLISRFQEEFAIEFTAVEIEATQTVQDLFTLIARKTTT